MEAAKRKQALDFIWIGSDAWVSRESVVYGREEVNNTLLTCTLFSIMY